jgi:uncharacterized membrane protein
MTGTKAVPATARIRVRSGGDTGTGGPRAAPPRAWRIPALLGLVLLAANVCTAAGLRYPFVVPGLGLFLLVGLPTALLMVKVDWRTSGIAERLGYSLVTTLLLLMFGGLLINTILPLLGITDALGRIPVLILGDVLVAALLIWRRGRLAWRPRGMRSFRLTLQEKTVTRLSVASVVLAVIGASRLNNGAGDSVSVVMLGLALLTLVLLFLWRDRLDPAVISFVIYALALALLFMTSMRGWYTTGHDIQREYRVFELTKIHGNWSIGRFRDAYNACLSITILPTMLWEVTKIQDPYIYKALYQVMFALCPVLIYRLSLRFTTPTISLIGVTYLLCFPTFSNDMAFLNRQEIAFLFITAILLVLTNDAMTLRQRRLWVAAFSLGLIVSHYSSAVVLIATVLAVAGIRLVARMAGRWRADRGPRQPAALPGRPRPLFGVLNITVLVVGAVLWIGVITFTGSTITKTLSGATASLGQTFSFSAKSSSVAYNLFSFSQPGSAQLLNEYRQQTVAEAGHRAGYYPLALVDALAPTRAVTITAPPTALGRDLGHLGINVTDVSTLIHGGAAKLLQLFILIGLIAPLFRKDVRFRLRREPYLFAVAALLVLLAEVVAPVISEDYGILRLFMQALLILSPVLAYGSVVACSALSRTWAPRLAIALVLFLFLSLSGLMPQLLGGYQQQLSLNNAGVYYDTYYPQAQEVVGLSWLRGRIPPALDTSVQWEVVADEFDVQPLRVYSGVNVMNDIYPTLLRPGSYVFLGSPTVRRGIATVFFKGNLVTYRYPTGFLRQEKDLIFDNGGAEVYR